MRRAIAIVLAGSFALPLPAQQSALQPQTIQMECRDFGPSGSNLAPDEILVNGKACREINAKDQPPNSLVRPAVKANIQARPGPIAELVRSSVNSVVQIVWTDENSGSVTFGSGFVVSPDGKIVTNHHVIAGAHSATVKMNNGAYFAVDGVLADDPDHDLAVIKVPGKNLPVLTLADSDGLSVGDHVLAIGTSGEWENSVSDGIISGIREDKGKTWIQTTAPASHGNSGGPLLLMDGKVAGVLTWKDFDGENLNFAAPSNLIAPLLTNSIVRPLKEVPNESTSTSVTTSYTVWTGHFFRFDPNETIRYKFGCDFRQ